MFNSNFKKFLNLYVKKVYLFIRVTHLRNIIAIIIAKSHYFYRIIWAEKKIESA